MKKTLLALFATFAICATLAFGAGASAVPQDYDVGDRIENPTAAGTNLQTTPALAALPMAMTAEQPKLVSFSCFAQPTTRTASAYFWPGRDSKASRCGTCGNIDKNKRIQHSPRYWRRC